VACSAWMQDVATKRAQASRQVFEDFKKIEGFRILAHDERMQHVSDSACILCRMRMVTSTPDSEDAKKAQKIQDAMNFVEAVVHSRNEHTLSETEFQALWAGVVDDLAGNLRQHMSSAWGAQIRNDSPLLALLIDGR